jgi:MFS family permease
MATFHPALRALSHRNYRLFFLGQGMSLVGTWMQRTALIWLVYRLTDSPFLTGLLTFCSQIPMFFLAPFGGVVTDRWNRYRTLLLTQTLSTLQALVLVALFVTGSLTIWEIMVLSLFLGLVSAVDMPARQAFLIEMVEAKEDLGSAIALNSMMVNGARLIGPGLAGAMIGLVGEGWCFLLNALSFAPVLAALLAMRLKPRAAAVHHSGVVQSFKEGFAYAFGFPPIRDLLLLLALVSFGGMPLMVLLPVFAREVLGGGADTFGLLNVAVGAGALAGGLSLAVRKSVLGLGRRIAQSAAVFGAGMIAFSLSASFPLSAAILAVAGFAMIFEMASSNTVLQTIVEEDKRGRVMSFYAMAFRGTAPLGSLLAGFAASRVGAPLTVRIGGLACIAGALLFAGRLPALRRLVRPIYQRMGILPRGPVEAPPTPEAPIPPSE